MVDFFVSRVLGCSTDRSPMRQFKIKSRDAELIADIRKEFIEILRRKEFDVDVEDE